VAAVPVFQIGALLAAPVAAPDSEVFAIGNMPSLYSE
jgi:hypothetical protein